MTSKEDTKLDNEMGNFQINTLFFGRLQINKVFFGYN